ncbi:MAG: hypothetical protein PHO00_00975 [bacterium]|nr:hypothetical protein [bacterium]
MPNIGNCRSQKCLSTTKSVFLGDKKTEKAQVFVADDKGNCVVIEVEPCVYREYAIDRVMATGMFFKAGMSRLRELSSNLTQSRLRLYRFYRK